VATISPSLYWRSKLLVDAGARKRCPGRGMRAGRLEAGELDKIAIAGGRLGSTTQVGNGVLLRVVCGSSIERYQYISLRMIGLIAAWCRASGQLGSETPYITRESVSARAPAYQLQSPLDHLRQLVAPSGRLVVAVVMGGGRKAKGVGGDRKRF